MDTKKEKTRKNFLSYILAQNEEKIKKLGVLEWIEMVG